MAYFADGDDELRSADNGRDGITTAWKLEGFQGRSMANGRMCRLRYAIIRPPASS
jgi:hypothetical protein